MNKVEIRREVEKLSSSYSAKDLFSSPYFTEMLQATVTAVCEKLGRIPDIYTICDENSDLTAATQGQVIMQNTMGPLIRNLETNWEKYVSNIGHIVHECGHVLFTDFETQNPMLNAWFSKEFSFYPRTPDLKGADEIKDYLNANPNFKAVYINCMRKIVNTLEDAYVENRLRLNFDGLAVAGLATANEEMYRLSPSLEEILDAVISGVSLPIMAVDNMLLVKYVVSKDLKQERKLTEEEKTLLKFLNDVLDTAKNDIESLLWEQDGKNRCELYNRLLVKLFALMPPPSENEKSEEGEKQSEDYSSNTSLNYLNESDKEEQRSGKSKEATGYTSSIKQKGNPKDLEESNAKREKSKKLSESKDSMERELQRAIREAVKSEVYARDEVEHAKELKKESKEIENDLKQIINGSTFKGYELHREKGNKDLYRKIYDSISNTSKNLSRKIDNILKDRETDSVESGFLMGQRFNALDVVRKDGKYFSRQLCPDGKPNVVFGILVDESGSMCTRYKAETARKTAILLEDSLRRLDIPLMVVGHTESSWGLCDLNVYVDFDTSDGKDCFRLASIGANGGNIDGAAISYISEKLLKRPEKTKVLIVISDGLPAGNSFYYENPKLDTKEAVRKYRKKGINIYGAVVDDFKLVSELYGEDSAFDCKKEGALETELIKIIKKYVLMKN